MKIQIRLDSVNKYGVEPERWQFENLETAILFLTKQKKARHISLMIYKDEFEETYTTSNQWDAIDKILTIIKILK